MIVHSQEKLLKVCSMPHLVCFEWHADCNCTCQWYEDLSALRRCLGQNLNTLQPISLMPSELLLTVFSHLVPNIGPIATSNDILVPFTQRDGMDALVAVSRVCQQWRDVAIGCPGLWCTIFVPRDLHLASTFLSLSRPLPIDLEVDYKVPPKSCWEKLDRFLGRLRLREPERVRSVYFRGMDEPEHLSYGLLQARLVNLQKVSIDFGVELVSHLRLSDILVSSATIVNLRQLALIGSEWVPVKFRGLTHLFMYGCQIYGAEGYQSFLDILEGVSRTLETLYLEFCGPGSVENKDEVMSYNIRPHDQRITMAALYSIHLFDLGLSGLPLHFMQHLTIPPRTTITWDVCITRFESGAAIENFELPPSDCLARVKRVLVGGIVSDKPPYSLFLLDQQREVLVIPDYTNFHHDEPGWYVVGRLPKYLPNLTTVYFYEVGSFHNIYQCLFYCYSVTTIVASVTSCDRVAKILAALETNSSPDLVQPDHVSGGDAPIVPALSSLTIYTGPLDFVKEQVRHKITEAMNKSGIPIPVLTIDVPQERERAQAEKTYILEFKSGDLNDHDAQFDFPFPREKRCYRR